MSNTSGVQQACRDYAEVTVGDPVANWHAVFDLDEIDPGDFNGRMLAWINAHLGSSHPDIAGAQQAFADNQGFNNWAGMNTVSFAPSWVLKVDGVAAIMDLDFVGDLSWFDGSDGTVTDVPGLENARLDANGLLVQASEPDDLVIDVGDITGFSESQFTIATHATAASDASGNYALWGIQASADDRHTQYRNTTPRITGFAAIGGTPTLTGIENTVTISNGLTFKTAWGVAANNLAFSVNGNAVVTDVSGAMPTGMTTFAVGRDHNTAYWEGRIRRLTLFGTRLGNAALRALSE